MLTPILADVLQPILRGPTEQWFSLSRMALSILRTFGTDAHVYLPGIGSVSGLTAGNYLDSNGSTGFAAVDGLDGLVLDAAGSVGAELVMNGGFDADANWTKGAGWSIAGAGVATAVSGGSLLQLISGVSRGSTYNVTGTATLTTGTLKIFLGGYESATVTASGAFSVFITPVNGASNTALEFTNNGAAFTGSIDNISVKQVTGTHATSTGAARPTLRRGAVNLLTNSNPAWSTVHGATGTTVVTTSQPDPYGGSTAQRLQAASNTDYALFQTTISSVTGSYTGAVMVKSNTGGSQAFQIWTDSVAGINVTATTDWTILAGTQTVTASTIFKILCSVSLDISVARIGLFQGTLTAAQILAEGGIPLTTTAAASNPNAGRYSLAFSGAQSLALGSVPFQMADDHCVIAGCRPDVNTKFAFAVGNGTTEVCNLGSRPGGYPFAEWKDDAATTQSLEYAVNKVGVPHVISGRKVVNAKVLRVDGVQQASGNTVMGTTTVTASNIGSQAGGGSLLWTGTIGPVIAIKGTVTDAQLLVLERFVSANTPNGPTF